MTFYMHDLIVFLLITTFSGMAFFVKSKKFKFGLFILAISIFILNPFRFKVDQEYRSAKFNSDFSEMPIKKEFQQPDFRERQAAEYKQLKQESKDNYHE